MDLTQTQEQILKLLISLPEQRFTIRGLARNLKKSYSLVYNNISVLEKNHVITKMDVPPAKVIMLDKSVSKFLLMDIENKRRMDFMNKHLWIRTFLEDLLNNVKSPFFILLIFGSYAKFKQNSTSDLDMLAIVESKKQIKDMEKSLDKIYTKIKKSIYVVDISSFQEMLSSKKINIGNESLKHHIVLHGVESYYHLL